MSNVVVACGKTFTAHLDLGGHLAWSFELNFCRKLSGGWRVLKLSRVLQLNVPGTCSVGVSNEESVWKGRIESRKLFCQFKRFFVGSLNGRGGPTELLCWVGCCLGVFSKFALGDKRFVGVPKETKDSLHRDLCLSFRYFCYCYNESNRIKQK